ncbi:MAG: hypothetical protein MUF48_06775 [Pirellulaceae bacterium]|nr:hypothetical protein [Pirellulaceae bacterium]
MTQLEQMLKHWQTMAQVQVRFIEALGQYKLHVAQAELVQAAAAGEWAVARIKAELVQELQTSLRRLNRARHTTARRVERLERHARALARIRSGEDLDPADLPLVWGAYTVFERAVPAATLERLMAMPLAASSRPGANFADVRRPTRSCPAVPDTVDNVHALLAWLKRRGLVPRRGSAAYRQALQAIGTLADFAAAEVTSLTSALRGIEQGTYDAWQPVVLAALPDSIDARKIIKLGTK